MKKLLWMGCLCYVLTGFTLVIVGSMLPELLAHYGKGYSSGGLLVFVQFVGLLVGVLGMPALLKIAGRRRTVGLGLVFMSAETLFLASPPWALTMPIVFLAGCGAGLVESSIGSLILHAAKDRPAAAMSKLEVTFGAGALAMPTLVAWLIAQDAWIAAFPVLGLSALLLAAVWMPMSFGEELDRFIGKSRGERRVRDEQPSQAAGGEGEGRSGIAAGSRSNGTAFALCALFFLLYGGSETSFIHFMPSVFIEDREAGTSVASLVVSDYWIGMIVGRALTGLLADRFGYYRFLLVSSAGAAVALAALAVGGGLAGGFVLAFFVGLFMSGLFAIALIFANTQMPGQTDRSTSLLMAVNGLGGALLPYLAGWTMETYPVRVTVWLMAAGMGLMLAFLVLVRFATFFSKVGEWYTGVKKWRDVP
ncbi:MFS transporter [Paenibacillus flagellatus]|uniref:MFS transporter n=1 Tax=Paenibacillus flagellatus TaxID=2211139 RepID=A0A2V5KUX8_9BACL|nr:MFS transporter [Paenibacillus flagellatus]PYI55827.1 MFS transporter [Paenibacillus flagellatus]